MGVSVPLKLKDSAGLQSFDSDDYDFLAYRAGLTLRQSDSSDKTAFSRFTSATQAKYTVGSFTNTSFDSNVGTGGDTSLLTTTQTTSYIYRNTGTDSIGTPETYADSDYANFLYQTDSNSQLQLKGFADSDWNVVTDEILSRIYKYDYVGSVRLASNVTDFDSASGGWSNILSNVFTDTRTSDSAGNRDSDNVVYSLFQKIDMTGIGVPSDSSRPFTLKYADMIQKTGFEGLQLADSDNLDKILGSRVRNRLISDESVGSFRVLSSAEGTPNDAGLSGTWISKGVATDTRKAIVDTNYTRTRTSSYARLRTSEYSTTFSDTYTVTRVSNYSDGYIGNYTSEYTRTRASTFTRNSTRTIITSYTGNYTGNYSRTVTTTGTYFYSTGSPQYYVYNYIDGQTEEELWVYNGVTVYARYFPNADQPSLGETRVGTDGVTYVRGTEQNQDYDPDTGEIDVYYSIAAQSTSTSDYTRTSTRTSTRSSLGNYTGNYSRNFVGNYTGNYVGNYTGADTSVPGGNTLTILGTHESSWGNVAGTQRSIAFNMPAGTKSVIVMSNVGTNGYRYTRLNSVNFNTPNQQTYSMTKVDSAYSGNAEYSFESSVFAFSAAGIDTPGMFGSMAGSIYITHSNNTQNYGASVKIIFLNKAFTNHNPTSPTYWFSRSTNITSNQGGVANHRFYIGGLSVGAATVYNAPTDGDTFIGATSAGSNHSFVNSDPVAHTGDRDGIYGYEVVSNGSGVLTNNATTPVSDGTSTYVARSTLSGRHRNDFGETQIFVSWRPQAFTDNLADYTRTSTRTSLRSRSSVFSQNYTRTRTSTYLAGTSFSRNFAGEYTGNYIGNFSRNFIGDYTRNFEGNYAGDTIGSGSSTIETYTLYVKVG